MTTLTEQWKKGNLHEGTYYVLYYGKDTAEVDIYRRVYSLYDDSEVRFTIPQVTEVLAEVPSYDEWQAKLEENAQLKELLKLMRSKIREVYDFNKFEFQIEGIFTKEDIMQIDQALGEE